MKKKYILFQSEQDDKLSLNMQALYKRMQERDLDKEYKIVFSLRKNTSERQTKISTFKMLRYMAIADIIIIDDHVPTYDWLLLDKKTKLIQIWHAGAGFKGVGYSRWGHLGCPGPFSCHRQYTYCIAGSKNIAHFFSEQFGIADEQVLPTGMPRMDQYLDVANREKITSKLLETYPKIKDNKVILFAPTYRGGNKATAYYPYQMIDFEALYEYCRAKHAIVFFKMHPWVSENVPIEDKYREYFFDLNTYSNINELFYITDLLITDYSSNMYEYALMGKPMLAFAYDKIQYATTRGFHRSYDDNVFGKVCETFEDLMKALWKEDYEFEKHKIYMKNHYEYTDCKNSDRVIDWVILDNMPEEYRKKLDAHIQKISEYRGKSYKYLIEELS